MLTKLKELRKSNEEGFTLVELLVVIIIIGILAAIALPIFLNQQKTAQDAKLKSDIKNAATATATLLTKNGGSLSKISADPTWNYIYSANNSTITGWMGNPKTEDGALVPYINVSEGVRLGVKITDASTGFCVVGVVEGGTYDGGVNVTSIDTAKTLYYDSVVGKIQTRAELSSTGGCKSIA